MIVILFFFSHNPGLDYEEVSVDLAEGSFE